MRTYIFTYERGKHDRNGNPRHWVTVYRVKKNIPERIGEAMRPVGYRGREQAVYDIIAEDYPSCRKLRRWAAIDKKLITILEV